MNPTSKFINDMKRAGGMTRAKLRRLKARTWKYPLALERQYTSSISSFLQKRWKAYAAIAVQMMVPREDALEDLEPEPGTNGPAIGGIVNIARTIDKFNKKELQAFKEIAIGEAFAEDEPWVKNVIDSWSREQVTLITKASQDMLDTVARRIREGVKAGKSARQVTAMINADLPGISYRRARIIARDQTAKLNSALTQGRMADAGIETYIWSTSEDERVRGNPTGLYPKALPSHYVMNGKICRWDDPTVWLENGEWVKRAGEAPYFHPGMVIMCRCVAIPNWDELEGVGASELPDIEQTEAPKTEIKETEIDDNLGVFTDEKIFIDMLSVRFPDSSRISSSVKKDAFSRIKQLDGAVQLAYSDTFTKFVNNVKSSSRSSFGVFGKEVKIKKNGSTGGDVVHELGHALDRKIGVANNALYASKIRLSKYGNRNLGEIVKDELVTPIVEAVTAERKDTVKRLLKEIPKECKTALKDAMNKAGSSRYDWIIAVRKSAKNMDDYRKVITVVGAIEDKSMFEALVNGENSKLVDYILERLERREFAGNLTAVDRYSKTLNGLVELSKKGGDEQSVYGALSDMFEAGTGIQNYFGIYGHGSRYWRGFDGDSNKCTEAFAEILEMLSSPNDNARKILDKYLPTARDFVLDLIKETK
jgi:SPP1 gp7 family putative phage head morphogenesis protein